MTDPAPIDERAVRGLILRGNGIRYDGINGALIGELTDALASLLRENERLRSVGAIHPGYGACTVCPPGVIVRAPHRHDASGAIVGLKL